MRRITIAILLCIAVRAAAQSTPCPTTPVFTVTPGPQVLLTVEHATPYVLDIPHATIAGREITVRQTPRDLPPPPGPPSIHCNRRTVSLGMLADGPYQVTWMYGVPSGVPGGPFQPFQTFDFAVTLGVAIPALDGPALLGLLLLLGAFGVMMLRR
jgi:hypothetical protein